LIKGQHCFNAVSATLTAYVTHAVIQYFFLYTAHGLHPNKRKIETKYKLPRLNWVTIPATQISGTVFHLLDDETVLQQLDFTDFEETFKMKTQAGKI
jgi:hypothetical protein